MRRARIICTLGPSSRDPRIVRQLIKAGANVCRLNFSHGEPDEHRRAVEVVRREARRLGVTVGILQDLQGPRIRTGPVAAGQVPLLPGRSITLTTRRVPGDASCVSTTFSRLPREVSKGDSILLSDGLIRLEVTRVAGPDVVCRVIDGGPLEAHKGMNIPGRALSISALTAKDRRDLKLGVELGVDWVALSFVRSAADIRRLRVALKRLGADTPIVAKIEKPQAVSDLMGILGQADAVMVARGDLAVETSPEQVPVLQKRIIHEARRRGVPVITATQMLETMVRNPRPTRAEASDVANAIYDGTDAVMLSAETAVGDHPVETVRMMARIVESAEADVATRLLPPETASWWRLSVSDAICEAAAHAADGLSAAALVVLTRSGETARRVAQHRPQSPIVAFCPDPAVLRRVILYWGIDPRPAPWIRTTDAMITWISRATRRTGLARPGDLLVITAGTQVGKRGSTNLLKVHRVS